MSAILWTDRPDLRPWCATLAERAARWRPDPALDILDIDARLIVDAVAHAAADAAPWLVHPCINALTSPADDCRSERDVRFITWVAAHTPAAAVGAFTLTQPSWRWSVDGRAVPVPAGRHDLATLVADDPDLTVVGGAAAVVPSIAIDPFCRSTGLPLPLAWIEP